LTVGAGPVRLNGGVTRQTRDPVAVKSGSMMYVAEATKLVSVNVNIIVGARTAVNMNKMSIYDAKEVTMCL
jgi:hypothetical protein